MNFKQILSNSIIISIGSVGLIATFYTMVELMYFLSDPGYNRKLVVSKDVWLSASWSLFVNMSLVSLFILSHSLLALLTVKETMSKYGLGWVVYRTFYVIVTAASLQILVKYWYDIPEVTVWKFNMNFRPIWWLYTITHVFAWLIIYIGSICMDVNELIGIKQIYYSIMKLPDPNTRKSFQLRRLHSHMRHPSFLAFLLIFWCLPVMSLDRLLLATILTFYMYIAWNVDGSDYAYQYSQYITKFHELENLQN